MAKLRPSAPSPELQERAYRRGYQHGFRVARDFISSGIDLTQFDEHDRKLTAWRYGVGAFAASDPKKFRSPPRPFDGDIAEWHLPFGARRENVFHETEPTRGAWIQVEVPRPRPSKWKDWMSRAWVSEDFRVFVDSRMVGERVLMCAMWDGISLITVGDEVLLPLNWIIEEAKDPEDAEMFRFIRAKVVAFAAEVVAQA